MADAAVEFLLENLTQLLKYHVNLIINIKGDVEKLVQDVKIFRSFLQKVSSKKLRKDETLRLLVGEIRSVIYDADDVMEAYVTQAADKRTMAYFTGGATLIDIAKKVSQICDEINDIYGDKGKFDLAKFAIDDGQNEKPVQIEWVNLRDPKTKLTGVKVSFGGYETAATDLGNVTRSLPRDMLDTLSKSCMGEYLRMNFLLTRCQQMVYYVMNHEVTPKPNFDKTARFFKFGDVVCRFGRREYAIVSGLRFGPASFDPYGKHDMPEESVFERLFGGDDETTLADLRTAYVNKDFKVRGKAVDASNEDLVKLTKMYIAVSLVLGFDNSKKKIPTWLWVLVENDEEWEKFPWGSLAFQILLANIDCFTKEKKKSGNNYTLKGDTIGFSAWIYEVLPILGEMLGERAKYPAIPRFLQYTYALMRRGGFPKDEVFVNEVVQMLEPTKAEEETVWWKSLELEPAEDGFALKYDPYYSKRKEARKEKAEEDEDDEVKGKSYISSEVAMELNECKKILDELPEKLMEGMDKKMRDMMDARDKKMKDWMDGVRKQIVEQVAVKVTQTLLENAPQYTEPNFDHVVNVAKAYNILEGEGQNAGDKGGPSTIGDEPKEQPKEGTQQAGKANSERGVTEGNDPKTPIEPKV